MSDREDVFARAAAALDLDGRRLGRLDLFGGSVELWGTVDEAEVEWRRRSGVGAIVSREALDALWQLPYGLSVGLDTLDPTTRKTLGHLPAGVVDIEGGEVERLVHPAVRITGAVTTGGSWTPQLRRMSRLAPVCPRAVVLTGRKRTPERALAEAMFYEVGLIATRTDGALSIEHFPPPAEHRMGAYQWRIAELAFAATSVSEDAILDLRGGPRIRSDGVR